MKPAILFLSLASAVLAVPAPGGPGRELGLGGNCTTRPAPFAPGCGGGNSTAAGGITAAHIPDFGVEPGVPSAAQPGSCLGDGDKAIPCDCPPSKARFAAVLGTFVGRGRAGNDAVVFSTDFADQSAATNRDRISAMIVALQNLRFDDSGRSGDGCPLVAAPNFRAIGQQLEAGQDVRLRKRFY